MTGLLEVVSTALKAPMQTAQQRAASGQRVVGVLGADVPVELITASGSFALQLPVSDAKSTPDADRYLEATFSPQSRSIAQQWLNGDFNFIDTVILTRANDSDQRLYYYLSELQRLGITSGPRLLLYDLAKIPRSVSEEHSNAATRRLAADLGVEHAALPKSIAARNRRRTLFEALDKRRCSSAPPSGFEVERLLRAGDRCDPQQFNDALEIWLNTPATFWRGPRLLLVGSAPPDERVHTRVETAGGRIVAEVGDHSLARLGTSVQVSDDPFRSLAAHYQALPYGPRSFANRAATVVSKAVECGAHGVIFWVIEEDESLVWSVPEITAALTAAEIPLLCLTRCRWDCGDNTLDAIHTFVAELQVRS